MTQQTTHWKLPWATYTERCADTAVHGPLRVQLAATLTPILNKLQIMWFIDSGTLLGAWRDKGKMIPHDDDFDTGFFMSRKEIKEKYGTMKRLVDQLCKEIRSSLPPPYEARPVHSYCYKIEVFDPTLGKYLLSEEFDFHNVTVDISLYTDRIGDDDKNLITSTHLMFDFMAFKREDLFPLGTITYEGHEFPCPRNCEAFLTELYGYLGRDAVYCRVKRRYVKKSTEQEQEDETAKVSHNKIGVINKL